MNRVSSLMVISLGLVTLTLLVMFAGNVLVDLVPDQSAEELEYRHALTETLAVQYSKLAGTGDSAIIKYALQVLVERNKDVVSAALRRSDGSMLVKAGAQAEALEQPSGEPATFDHVQVPIFSEGVPWGILQVTFRRTAVADVEGLWPGPWVQFVAVVAVVGFLGYLLFMKKTLRQLDPSNVVPTRVKAALDVLAEGVVLLDTSEFIQLANTAFAEQLGREPAELLGLALSELQWKAPQGEAAPETYPWHTAMQTREPQTGVRLLLAEGPNGDTKNFLVNSAPILDEEGVVRGVLTSFDDVTQLDHANANLTNVVKQLELSREEVLRQNAELGRLATRDPLTGCLNRRAFFTKMETAFTAARLEGAELSCLMVDIDHFKLINDRHGHAVGDQAINVVARALSAALRPTDLLGRYGGEEFCIVLPGQVAAQAARVADRIRQRIETECGAAIRSIAGIRITVSLGVSSTAFGATEPLQLIDQADKALYAAKGSGRNCVMCWDQSGQPQVPSGARGHQAPGMAGHPVGSHHA